MFPPKERKSDVNLPSLNWYICNSILGGGFRGTLIGHEYRFNSLLVPGQGIGLNQHGNDRPAEKHPQDVHLRYRVTNVAAKRIRCGASH